MLLKFLAQFIPVIAFLAAVLCKADPATVALCMTFWMVSWWILEVMPLGITALIPIIVLPLTNIMPLSEVTAHYSNSVIYLFLGGFIIARALEKTRLSERFALVILSVTGRSSGGILVGFVIATAFLSMWISNTATAVMMVPIGLSVTNFLRLQFPEKSTAIDAFSVVLFLTIAYSANIGGIMTPVGTPPNVVLLGLLNESYKIQIDFWKWMAATIPVGVCLLTIQTVLLNKLFHYDISLGAQFQPYIRDKIKKLGPTDAAQKVTLFAFCTTCFLWVMKDVVHLMFDGKFLNDTSIAIFGSLLLFLVPTAPKFKEPVLESNDIGLLPWNIILLFGGGMAMAASLKEVGLIQLVTQQLSSVHIGSPYLLVCLLAAATLLLTEIMSNVALAVVALPIFMELGAQYQLSPVTVGVPVAICASMAFSMPISTPPNAIVFGTNLISVKQMLKAGLLLNVISIFVVMTLGWYGLKFLG